MATEAGFSAFVGRLDEPVYVVTLAHEGTRAGCLIGFGGQVSIDPPRFLACLSDKNRTYRVAARGAEHLAIHLVPAEHPELAELFGGETGDDLDKFERCAWHDGPHGAPLLDDCPTWFVGRVLERRPLGDHVGFLLEPVAGAAGDEAWLPQSAVIDIDAGHEA
jgi:flavin reductase (DIM6/NTAB) family NADH-FMN oxidoreductase RutF